MAGFVDMIVVNNHSSDDEEHSSSTACLVKALQGSLYMLVCDIFWITK